MIPYIFLLDQNQEIFIGINNNFGKAPHVGKQGKKGSVLENIRKQLLFC